MHFYIFLLSVISQRVQFISISFLPIIPHNMGSNLLEQSELYQEVFIPVNRVEFLVSENNMSSDQA